MRKRLLVGLLTSLLMVGMLSSNVLASFTTYNGGSAAETDWQKASGATNLENFESYSAGTQISDLPTLGVGFDLLAGGGFPVTYRHGRGTPHGPMHLANFPGGINNRNRWDDITLHVLDGYKITALGFWNGDGQGDTLTASAYDASNNVIGSVGAFRSTFAGFTSDIPISYVVFDGVTGDGWNHLDGLQTNATVPVPGAVWLLTSGLAGIIGIRKKSRRQLS